MAIDRAAFTGCLLGMAVGDAMGLPYEGLSRRRAARLLGEPGQYRFVLGMGMVSDDTEHACLVAQALIAAGDDEHAFARQLSRRLRWWLLGVPAGIGLATLKATLRLWLGVPPQRSGVFSAGNGPAMRSPVLGAAIDDLDLLRRLVRASTRLTHTDPKAEHGALAVALAARLAAHNEALDGTRYLTELRTICHDNSANELLQLIERAIESCGRHESTVEFADSLGLGQRVTGYIYHTVPIVLHAWLSHPRDLPAAVNAAIRCGGDTDTTAAIVGGIVGCGVGPQGIPQAWLDGLWEWPRSVSWMEQLAATLYASRCQHAAVPPRLPVPGLLLRNAGFALLVLLHGLRRLLPPY